MTGTTPIRFFPVDDDEHPIWQHHTLSLGEPTCTMTDLTLAATAQFLLALDRLTETLMRQWFEERERTMATKIVNQEIATQMDALAHQTQLDQIAAQAEIANVKLQLDATRAQIEEVTKEKEAQAEKAHLDLFSAQVKSRGLKYRLDNALAKMEESRKEKDSDLVGLCHQRDAVRAELDAAQEEIKKLKEALKETETKKPQEDGPFEGTCARTTPVVRGEMFSWRASGVIDMQTQKALQEIQTEPGCKIKVTPRKSTFMKLPGGRYVFPGPVPTLSPEIRAAVKRKIDGMTA